MLPSNPNGPPRTFKSKSCIFPMLALSITPRTTNHNVIITAPGIKALKLLATAGGTASGNFICISFLMNHLKIKDEIIPTIIATNKPLLPINPTGIPAPASPLTKGVTTTKEERDIIPAETPSTSY